MRYFWHCPCCLRRGGTYAAPRIWGPTRLAQPRRVRSWIRIRPSFTVDCQHLFRPTAKMASLSSDSRVTGLGLCSSRLFQECITPPWHVSASLAFNRQHDHEPPPSQVSEPHDLGLTTYGSDQEPLFRNSPRSASHYNPHRCKRCQDEWVLEQLTCRFGLYLNLGTIGRNKRFRMPTRTTSRLVGLGLGLDIGIDS